MQTDTGKKHENMTHNKQIVLIMQPIFFTYATEAVNVKTNQQYQGNSSVN